jgi:hypothetical protein
MGKEELQKGYMMTEHESLVRVTLSVPVDVPTESHPEDIAEDTMREIIVDYLFDALDKLVDYGDIATLMSYMKKWDIEDVQMRDLDQEEE